jgi:hypothetical protein
MKREENHRVILPSTTFLLVILVDNKDMLPFIACGRRKFNLKMVRKKTQDHKSRKGPSEKKNEEAIVNMVTVITTSKAPKEVSFLLLLILGFFSFEWQFMIKIV